MGYAAYGGPGYPPAGYAPYGSPPVEILGPMSMQPYSPSMGNVPGTSLRGTGQPAVQWVGAMVD